MSCVCWIMSKYEPHSGKLHAFICVLEHNGPATTLKNRAVRLELTRYYRHYQIYNVPVRRHKHALNIAHDKIQQYFKVVLRTIGTPKISLLPGADHASSGHSRELSKGSGQFYKAPNSKAIIVLSIRNHYFFLLKLSLQFLLHISQHTAAQSAQCNPQPA